MKVLIVCASLAVNLALAVVLVERPSLAPPRGRDFILAHRAVAADAGSGASKPTEAARPAPKLWARLGSSDLRTLKGRLLAAGFPAQTVRSIIVALLDAEYTPRIRALTLPDTSVPFWKQKPMFIAFGDKRYLDMQQLQRERSKAIRDLTADLAMADVDLSAAQRHRYGNLSPAKIDLMQRIDDDYAEMTAAIRAGMNGIELQEDRDKLALLTKEKRSDLAAVLTPDELADYEARSSPLTHALTSRLSAFDPSEAEYRAIFQAYQSFGEKVGTDSGDLVMDPNARRQAEQSLGATLKATLGDARYEQFLRAATPEYQQLTRMVQQQNLPADTADRAFALRDSVSQQSIQIAEDPNLTREAKRAALQNLAQNTRLQLTSMIPGEAVEAYVKRAGWLTMLDRGIAVSITPNPPLIIANSSGGVTSWTSGSEIRPIPPKPVRGKP